MVDKNSSKSRRNLLKSIAAGSGAVIAGKSLPESWTRPVVDSVMLPAHAQTSPCTIIAGSYCAFVGGGGNDGELTIVVSADGMVDITWRRQNNLRIRTFEGSGLADNDGYFDITAVSDDGRRTRFRYFTGTIDCASNSISGVYNNDNNPPFLNLPYTAIPGTCADFVLTPDP